MARKKKPVDAEFNTIDMDGDKPTQSPVANDQTATVATVVEDRLAGTGDVKDEIAEKLEQFEKLEKAAAELSAENQALKDKLAEYVQNAQKPKTNEFEKELAQLRDENDKYLMRISELTFENAKMHAELDELKKKISVIG